MEVEEKRGREKGLKKGKKYECISGCKRKEMEEAEELG